MFSHLRDLGLQGKLAWVHFPEISPDARVQVAPALQENAAYFNAVLRSIGKPKDLEERPKRRDLTVADLDKSRNEDRVLYGDHIVQNFEGFLDENKVAVPFSRKAAKELCQQLPGWLFDRLRQVASEPSNFVRPAMDIEAYAGNSESGSGTD